MAVSIVYCRVPRNSCCFALAVLNGVVQNAQYVMVFTHLRGFRKRLLCPYILFGVSVAIVQPVWSGPYYVPFNTDWTQCHVAHAVAEIFVGLSPYTVPPVPVVCRAEFMVVVRLFFGVQMEQCVGLSFVWSAGYRCTMRES